ncbi:MAG: PfkB family carbohydrate kinase [Thermoanaerobaculia bacterium]|nr:PfkB family carbohydrate kinase [Thermoanaerobaculia bacterium]
MSIVVVGSVAFDSLETPFGKVDKAIGGAATYFSVAASYFSPVRLVAVIGDDFGDSEMKIFEGRDIDTTGLQRVEGGKTFHWSGEYGYDLNVAKTRDTQLNVFADFDPTLPDTYRDSEFVFLAKIDPELQEKVLEQVESPKLVALDTMNFWIEQNRDGLERVMRKVDLVVINEGEVRQFTDEPNLVKGGRKLMELGPKWIVIKRGEYGVIMMSEDHIFAAPAYPLESVFDPTGAGDSFAGGMVGFLATNGEITNRRLRQAIVFGSVVASFTVEKFSLDRLREV